MKRAFHAAVLAMVAPVAAMAADVNVVLSHEAVAEPGEMVHVEAFVSNDTTKSIAVRLLRLDFNVTELVPTGFKFEESELVSGGLYAKFSQPPIYWEANSASTFIPGFYHVIPAGGSLLLASWEVTAPPSPGSYFIDVANFGAQNVHMEGARLDYGFGVLPDDPVTILWAGDGTLGGAVSQLTVVPEPAGLLLLGMGAALFGTRRGSAR